jgi:hypothetical protein
VRVVITALAFVFLGWLFWPGPAVPPIIVNTSFGGSVEEFFDKYEDMRATQRPMEIRGQFCISACTIALSVMPKDRLCATPYTLFGFHTASGGAGFDPEMNRVLSGTYPARLLEILKAHGLDFTTPHPDVVFLRPAEMGGVINICKGQS